MRRFAATKLEWQIPLWSLDASALQQHVCYALILPARPVGVSMLAPDTKHYASAAGYALWRHKT